MEYLVSASSDIGISKHTNQDSLTVKVARCSMGTVAFAVLCDGMGGLEQGEVASATVVQEFAEWFCNGFASNSIHTVEDYMIKEQWGTMITSLNSKISAYGNSKGIRLGTTLTALLLTPNRYYVVNVGDTRAYELTSSLRLLTEDQTLVNREQKQGLLTEEQAKVDPRRSVLLQCIGASKEVYPDMFFGTPKKDAVYMLCSDGFRHEITEDEIYHHLCPNVLISKEQMMANCQYLIEVNKQRQERDNISVITIRTY